MAFQSLNSMLWVTTVRSLMFERKWYKLTCRFHTDYWLFFSYYSGPRMYIQYLTFFIYLALLFVVTILTVFRLHCTPV